MHSGFRTFNLRALAVTLVFGTAISGLAQPIYFPIAPKSVAMSVASDGNNFVVGLENHATARPTIGAQLFSPTGAKLGSTIATGRSGIATALAFDGVNYLLVWEDDGLGTLSGDTGWAVYGQFISTTGMIVGAPFAISSAGIWFDGIKTMAFGGGKYLVTYTRLINPALGATSNNRYIAGRMVRPDGSMDAEFRISTGYGKASDVAFDGTNFFVVWCEDNADQEIRGRFVSTAGAPGAEVVVNASPAPSDNPKSVAFDGVNYLVVWNDEVGGMETGTWDCFGQLVSTAGARVGGVIPITTDPGPQMATTVAFDGNSYLAAWVDMANQTDWNLYAQCIGRDGSPVGARMTLSAELGNQLGGVGFGSGQYVAMVNNGVELGDGGITAVISAQGLFISPPAPPRIQVGGQHFGVRNNQFGFEVTGLSGQGVVIETSASAADAAWTPIATNTLTGSPWLFTDPQWTGNARRFYRVRYQ